MSPAEADTYAGKMQFLACAMFGKVAAAPLKPIYALGRAPNLDRYKKYPISIHVRLCLEWFQRILRKIPKRIMRDPHNPPREFRIFVDASSDAAVNSGTLGAVVFSVEAPMDMFFVSWVMPTEFFAFLKPRGNFIQFLEMSACILALRTWHRKLRGANVIMYCDNNGQLGALSHGFAKQWDYTVVASVFWELACIGNIHILLRRVPSDFNIADIPSRPADREPYNWMCNFARETNAGDMSCLREALDRLVRVGFSATATASHLD